MTKKPVCLVCQKEMEQGFIAQPGMPVNLPRWCPGTPAPGMFGDVKRSQADAGFAVTAYRCPECEALRLYAPSKT